MEVKKKFLKKSQKVNKVSKHLIHEHLEHYLKSTYAERLLWLTKANKMVRKLQNAKP